MEMFWSVGKMYWTGSRSLQKNLAISSSDLFILPKLDSAIWPKCSIPHRRSLAQSRDGASTAFAKLIVARLEVGLAEGETNGQFVGNALRCPLSKCASSHSAR